MSGIVGQYSCVWDSGQYSCVWDSGTVLIRIILCLYAHLLDRGSTYVSAIVGVCTCACMHVSRIV